MQPHCHCCDCEQISEAANPAIYATDRTTSAGKCFETTYVFRFNKKDDLYRKDDRAMRPI